MINFVNLKFWSKMVRADIPDITGKNCVCG